MDSRNSVSSPQDGATGAHDQYPVEEDQTPTQRIWRPVADLDREHIQLFSELQAVMGRGDIDGASAIRIRIGQIEVEQRQAHIAARSYLLAKVQKQAAKNG